MRHFWLLLQPQIQSARNRIFKSGRGGAFRTAAFTLFAAVFWAGLFILTVKVLKNFKNVEEFGLILSYKLLGLIWLTGMALLFFSTLISTLSSFYLARDLDLLHGAPVGGETFFWSRSVLALGVSVWMPITFGLPVFLAYGFVFQAAFSYYPLLIAAGLGLAVLSGYLAVSLVMALVYLLPARRARDVLILLFLAAFVILYLLFRFAQPEKLLNPDAFITMAGYLSSLRTPSSHFLPSQWVTETLWPSLTGEPGLTSPWFLLLLLWSTALMSAVAASILARWLYGTGYGKSQEGGGRRAGLSRLLEQGAALAGRFFSPRLRPLAVKDIKTFFRDSTQWSQLLLLGALVVIYLYNFSALDFTMLPPRATLVIGDIVAFANMALVSLVTATLALRFAFPSVSGEGHSFWIIKAAPVSLKDFLWHKFKFWLGPLLGLALLLTVLSNLLLRTSSFMMTVSVISALAVTPGLCALAVGLGAVYPQFESENLAQTASSFGGLIFMLTASVFIGLVILLEAGLVVLILREQAGRPAFSLGLKILANLAFLGALLLSAGMAVVPMRKGLLALGRREED